jgi:SAM-dependent methyltransferase
MDWFENWFGSPFYKLLYQNRDDCEARRFTDELICYLQPPAGCRMLDIACGEGRFAIHLAEKGYDVTGIDISQASIEHAKAYETERLHFYEHDMRFPFYINYFDFAFNFFTSFGYFKYERDNRMAARAFAGALKPGGTLVIDYLNYRNVIKSMASEATIQREDVTFHIRKKYDGKHIRKDIAFTDQEGVERNYVEKVATFSLQDFTTMFGNAGMELVQTFGDYNLNPYNMEDSPRMIMVFKKK